MSVSREPALPIAELNDIFTSLDRIAEQYGCERIKTMGDACLVRPSGHHAACRW
jgi:hypothetical protein